MQLSNFKFVELLKIDFLFNIFVLSPNLPPGVAAPHAPALGRRLDTTCRYQPMWRGTDSLTLCPLYPQRGSLYSSTAESWSHKQYPFSQNRTRTLPSIASAFIELPWLIHLLSQWHSNEVAWKFSFFLFLFFVLAFSHSVSFYSLRFSLIISQIACLSWLAFQSTVCDEHEVAFCNVRLRLVRHLIFCCLYYRLNITTVITITITTMILVSWTMF